MVLIHSFGDYIVIAQLKQGAKQEKYEKLGRVTGGFYKIKKIMHFISAFQP
jgi:ribosome maturation protein Sdo1